MNGYILRRVDQGGGYVALPGSRKSYTKDRAKARMWPSRSAAEAEACGNEVVDYSPGFADGR